MTRNCAITFSSYRQQNCRHMLLTGNGNAEAWILELWLPDHWTRSEMNVTNNEIQKCVYCERHHLLVCVDFFQMSC